MRGIKVASLTVVVFGIFLSIGAVTSGDAPSVQAAPWRKPTPTPTRTSTPSPSPTAPPSSTPGPSPTATPSNTPTVTPSPSSSATPSVPPTGLATVTSTASPTAVPSPAAPRYGLIGGGGDYEPLDSGLIASQYQAGIRMRLIEPRWENLQPNGPGDWNANAVAAIQQHIDAFTAAGPDVRLSLDLGTQYPPGWVVAMDPLIDQYGNVWLGTTSVGGGVNSYWSPNVRYAVSTYITQLLGSLDFHGRLDVVRVGPFGGELLFPKVDHGTSPPSFWAYDAYAQSLCPVPGWMPGMPSPNGENQTFYFWYVDRLVDTFSFYKAAINAAMPDVAVAPVTPGLGVTDGGLSTLYAYDFAPPGWCCTGTGNYWPRLFRELPVGGVWNWCSSVGDASGTNDAGTRYDDWSSAHQMAYLAAEAGRPIVAENPGRNDYDTSCGAAANSTMLWDVQALHTWGFRTLMWVRQSDMTQGCYATLPQYANAIQDNP